ncbi:alpha/beta hydrolase [Nonomuraea sp. NPDC048826]|uniref:alpha/beta hydrolase n=1 Tax=Nonomuraea sp. NPDC048826 TaxID=3364347 RepID=UPI00371E96D4
MRRLRGVIAPLITGLLLAGLGITAPAGATATSVSTSAAAETDHHRQRLDWTGCGGGFECAKLKVPVDYRKPRGKRIEIAVIRLPATGGKKIGSLVLNPGGPGGSGVDLARAAKAIFPAAIRSRFDIVGFDPRGVGLSAPVRCLPPGLMDTYHALDPTPDTPTEVRVGDAYQKIYAQACHQNARGLLAHLGTRNVVRDLDVLRAALGDRRLTYLGFSYGTVIGAHYAEMYPERVRALVLDGAVDPVTWGTEAAGQARGFEKAFTAFLRDCAKTRGCPFRTGATSASFKKLTGLLKRADRSPLRNTADGRQVNEAIVFRGVVQALYAKELWPRLRAALAAGFRGDGTALLALSDNYTGRRFDGTYDNSGEAFTAISCADQPQVTTADASVVTEAPGARYFGAYFSDGLLSPCAFWPVKGKAGPAYGRALRAEGAPPILVVGTTRDPATPYRSARRLAAQLSSGVLLGYDGDGHTAYGKSSACVNSAVDRYLITRVPPKNGTLCR